MHSTEPGSEIGEFDITLNMVREVYIAVEAPLSKHLCPQSTVSGIVWISVIFLLHRPAQLSFGFGLIIQTSNQNLLRFENVYRFNLLY